MVEQNDNITMEYQVTLGAIDDLLADEAFWRSTMESPQVAAFLTDLQKEIEATELSWESIAPKEFAQSQAEVKAKIWIIDRLNSKRHESDKLRSKLRLKLEMEMNYPLILAAAGYDFAPVTALPVEQESLPEIEVGSALLDNEEDQFFAGEKPVVEPKSKKKKARK